MPELPEVETTCRGIAPHITGHAVTEVTVLQPSLRWPVSPELADLVGQKVETVTRRAKYLLLGFGSQTVVIHLGMSGSLRVIDPTADLRKHDHVHISFSNGLQLRYHDPRRFGCILWTDKPAEEHHLISHLGPEPLSEQFSSSLLSEKGQGKSTTVKQFIMDGKVVVGVGNIYACEALFAAGIDPRRSISRISAKRLASLTTEIKAVLAFAIEQGGTTLRDFLREDGTAGYFKQQLAVYDREGEPCLKCQSPIKRVVLGQRSTFFCSRCQR